MTVRNIKLSPHHCSKVIVSAISVLIYRNFWWCWWWESQITVIKNIQITWRGYISFGLFKIELTRLASSKSKSVRTASKNALFEILGRPSEEKKHTGKNATDDNITQQKQKGAKEGHVMISYNWTHQKLALKLRDDLNKAGYKVWIDVDEMGMYLHVDCLLIYFI